jgi:hypothetical protein
MPKSKLLLAMSRGKIWVDENLLSLPKELEKRNFRVTVVPRGMKDEDIKLLIADQRFVTANTDDFSSDISSYEYCLISVKSIQRMEPSALADRISKVWMDLELRGKHTCLVTILRNTANISYPNEMKV